MADNAMLAMRIDGVDHPSWGVAGGKSAGSGSATVNPGTPSEAPPGAALSDGNILRRGDILRLDAPAVAADTAIHSTDRTERVSGRCAGWLRLRRRQRGNITAW